MDAFRAKKRAFCFFAPTIVVSELAMSAYDAMARYARIEVVLHNRTDRAGSTWMPNSHRDLSITAGFSFRDVPHRLFDSLRE
jgi:hypothetical protein